MTAARFVLEESSWATATKSEVGVLSEAIEKLLDRLDTTRERSEVVVKHDSYDQTPLGDDVQLFSVLYDPNCSLKLNRDLTLRLSIALDQIQKFDDSELDDYEAEFEGSIRFSPGAAWAHALCSRQRQIAVLPLSLGYASHGQVPVTVAESTLEVFFVTEESEHADFFRRVITLENANEEMFERLAPSAFPALEWAEGVWRGLGAFSRPYTNVRTELVRHLGGLSDHGAACFHKYGSGDPRELQEVLSAKVGARISDENGATKRHRPSKLNRTRRYRGASRVFWWHIKLQPHIDRIHFLYEPSARDSRLSPSGHIVVGLFTDHCTLPNRAN